MHGDWGASTRLAIQAGSCMITPRVCLLVESVSLPLHYRNTGTGLSQEYSVMGPTPAHHRNKQTNWLQMPKCVVILHICYPAVFSSCEPFQIPSYQFVLLQGILLLLLLQEKHCARQHLPVPLHQGSQLGHFFTP